MPTFRLALRHMARGVVLVASCTPERATSRSVHDVEDAAYVDVSADSPGDLGGQPECRLRSDCLPHSVCEHGLCVDAHGATCEHDADCGAADRCDHARCVLRSHATRGFVVAELDLPGITDRRGVPTGSALGYSTGGGLADIDGDMLLDVVVALDAAAGPAPCVFRNTSTPGEVRFEPLNDLCEPASPMTAAVFGVDVDNDGVDELLELGNRHVVLHRRFPRRERVDLLAQFDADDPRSRCTAGVALPTDLDHDGKIDLVVGCQFDSSPGEGIPTDVDELRDFVLLQTDSGGFVAPDDSRWIALAEPGVSLSIASVDFDADGLLDVIVAADTASEPGRRNLGIWPGGYFRACSPLEDCTFEFHPFAADPSAWGSYMGTAVVTTEAHGDLIYLTNVGPNRLLQGAPDGLIELAEDLGVTLAGSGPPFWYSWAALVDDLDRNGVDDIYVGQGSLPPYAYRVQYRDAALLQYGGGLFDVRYDVRPLPGPFVTAAMPSTRGGARVDLDHDGSLEFVLATYGRDFDVLTEVVDVYGADPPRCTLVPRPSVVITHGHGYRIADDSTGIFRVRDVQGQHRFGQPTHITASFTRGTVRFPSGAELAFDCAGQAGPFVIEEPDWIEVGREGDRVTVRLDAPWFVSPPDVTLAVEVADGSVSEAVATPTDGVWFAPLPTDADRVMLRLNGRWVARWWPLDD